MTPQLLAVALLWVAAILALYLPIPDTQQKGYIMSDPIIHLPAGVECGVTYFLTSDKAGADVAVKLSGLTIVPEFKAFDSFDGSRLLNTIAAAGVDLDPLLNAADDWRLMSRAEVATYKADHR